MKRTIGPLPIIAAIIFMSVLIIPTLLVVPFMDKSDEETVPVFVQTNEAVPVHTVEPSLEVSVYRTKESLVEKLELEEYVIGVVASEMPAAFEMEALKAQALSARTYIVKHLLDDKKMNVPQGANVTDTQLHQVFKNEDQLKTEWGIEYNWKMERIKQAVYETRGQILTYNDNPIDAAFFSTSNGYTENSEDYWQNSIPYLRSVKSPWDKESPKYSSQEVLTINEFENKLGVKLPSSGIGEIKARTEGSRVASVVIGGKTFSGRAVRESLGLRSSDFTWERRGNQIIIYTKGYGHGVGMSQYGANGMAQAGNDYLEIVKYYYQGIDIANIQQYENKITAKK